MSARNWKKDRNRCLVRRAAQQQYDSDAALGLAGTNMEALAARYRAMDEAAKPRTATLRCTCGHSATVTVAPGRTFRCSRCRKLWFT